MVSDPHNLISSNRKLGDSVMTFMIPELLAPSGFSPKRSSKRAGQRRVRIGVDARQSIYSGRTESGNICKNLADKAALTGVMGSSRVSDQLFINNFA